MKDRMPDYYHPTREIKERQEIRDVNRLKRWNSGAAMISNLVKESGSYSHWLINEYPL